MFLRRVASVVGAVVVFAAVSVASGPVSAGAVPGLPGAGEEPVRWVPSPGRVLRGRAVSWGGRDCLDRESTAHHRLVHRLCRGQATQQWSWEDGGDGYWRIRSVESPKECVDVQGQLLLVRPCRASEGQRWAIWSQHDREDVAWMSPESGPGTCAGLDGVPGSVGVVVTPCEGSIRQHWIFAT